MAKFDAEKQKQLTSINASKNDKNGAIKNRIKTSLVKFSKQKTDNIESLREMVIEIHEDCFKSLKGLQDNVIDEIKVLYSPLTKTDKDTISNAELNAEKAKRLVDVDKEVKVRPASTIWEVDFEEIVEKLGSQ